MEQLVNNAHFRATIDQVQGEFIIDLPSGGIIVVNGNVQEISATGQPDAGPGHFTITFEY